MEREFKRIINNSKADATLMTNWRVEQGQDKNFLSPPPYMQQTAQKIGPLNDFPIKKTHNPSPKEKIPPHSNRLENKYKVVKSRKQEKSPPQKNKI